MAELGGVLKACASQASLELDSEGNEMQHGPADYC